MERRELDKQTDQPGEAGSSRQRRQGRNVPLGTLTLVTAEALARPGCHSTLPGATVQLNYSFHGNQWRKSNQSSSLQTLRAFQ